MTAYLVADVDIHDEATYDQYRQQVRDLVDAHGGRFLVRGGNCRALEGDWAPRRLVIIEFPSAEALQAFYDSPGYAPLIALRRSATTSKLIAAEGVGQVP
jgi:uncharacterized protein (DUF1330 family)